MAPSTDRVPDVCPTCGRQIGRSRRTNEELLAALRSGEFLTAFGVTDYSREPSVTTYYCGRCYPSNGKGT